MTKNVNKVLLVIVIILIFVLIGIILKQTIFSKSSSYYAVYLRTGELYFGKLSFFPSFKLKNVYLLQLNAQNNQNPVSIQKLTNVFWGPEDYLKINKDNIVWYTRISPQSQLVSFFEGNLNPQQQPAPLPQNQENIQKEPSTNSTSSGARN